jgi:outer membrane protein
MKRYTLFAVVLGLCAVGPAASAQQALPTKVAYVNVRAVLQQTPEYVKAESLFTKELDGYRAQVAKMQAQLDSASAEFEQQSVLLSPSARNAKRKDLEDKAAALQQQTQSMQQQAAARERELLDPIQSRVSAVIEGIRAEGNYAMIFDVSNANGIVAADKALDLTEKVLDRLKASK